MRNKEFKNPSKIILLKQQSSPQLECKRPRCVNLPVIDETFPTTHPTMN